MSAASGIAGALGGMAAMATTYPLGLVATRNAVSVGSRSDDSKKISSLETAQQIIETEGIAGLYQGISSSLFGVALTNGVFYWAFAFSNNLLASTSISSPNPNAPKKLGPSVLESMAASTVAGLITSAVTNPVWVVNTRQATHRSAATSGHVPSFLETARAMYNTEGIPSFFAGLLPALGLVSNPVIQYTVAEQLKKFLLARKRVKLAAGTLVGVLALSDIQNFLVGAIGKLIATVITFPYLIVKTRLQARRRARQGEHAERSEEQGVMAELMDIVHTDGFMGLYAGLQPKLVQSVLSAALLFYSQAKILSWVLRLLSWNQAQQER